MKLDNTDLKILNILSEDGRASLRKIASLTNLTTPTVSNHLSKLIKVGLIQRFVPLFNTEKLEQGVVALISLKIPQVIFDSWLKKLKKMKEVCGIYLTAERNVLLKVSFKSMSELDIFISSKIAKSGLEIIGNILVLKTVKDEQPFNVGSNLLIDAECDFCGGKITSEKPYSIKVGALKYLFCCRTCRSSYIEKNKARLEKLGFLQKKALQM